MRLEPVVPQPGGPPAAEAALFINGTGIRPHIWGEGNTAFLPQAQ